MLVWFYPQVILPYHLQAIPSGIHTVNATIAFQLLIPIHFAMYCFCYCIFAPQFYQKTLSETTKYNKININKIPPKFKFLLSVTHHSKVY